MFGVKRFAKGIAKAQFRSYMGFKRAHPNADAQTLYAATISMRPGYDEAAVASIIELAREIEPFNLRAIAVTLACTELGQLTKSSVSEKDFNNIMVGVSSVIPVEA